MPDRNPTLLNKHTWESHFSFATVCEHKFAYDVSGAI
jgi:hypothetical protein